MDQEEIKKKFNKKQNIQLVIYILMIFITPMAVIFDPRVSVKILEKSLPAIFEYSVVGIMIIVILGTIINWRCPVKRDGSF